MMSLESPQSKHSDSEKENLSSPHILVVDEDEQNAMWLREYFKVKGYTATVVNNNREGIHLLNTQPLDGILLSLDDTEENRMDFLNYTKGYFPDVAVFAMAKELDSEAIRESFGEGVKGFISKPILHDQLQEVLFEFQRRRGDV